jgi:hypothetical protein
MSLAQTLRDHYSDFTVGFEPENEEDTPIWFRVNKPILSKRSGFFRSYFDPDADTKLLPSSPITINRNRTRLMFPSGHAVTPHVFKHLIDLWYELEPEEPVYSVFDGNIQEQIYQACTYLSCDSYTIQVKPIFDHSGWKWEYDPANFTFTVSTVPSSYKAKLAFGSIKTFRLENLGHVAPELVDIVNQQLVLSSGGQLPKLIESITPTTYVKGRDLFGKPDCGTCFNLRLFHGITFKISESHYDTLHSALEGIITQNVALISRYFGLNQKPCLSPRSDRNDRFDRSEPYVTIAMRERSDEA